MKKSYIVPQVEDIQLDPLMSSGIEIAATSNVQVENADAPARGETLKYL